MAAFDDLLALSGPNSGFIRDLYELYEKDPSLVGKTWADLFEKFSDKTSGYKNGSANGHTNGYEPRAVATATISNERSPVSALTLELQERVQKLVSCYRNYGHLLAEINPLTQGVCPLPKAEDLHVSFNDEELRTVVRTGGLLGKQSSTVEEVLADLKSAYCGTIGFEYTHLISEEERLWLQVRIESGRKAYSAERRIRAFQKLVEAEQFESQLHTKYVGQKRFSLQGGETLIPILDTIIDRCGDVGIKEVVMGQAHRGRLNVLVNIAGKPIEDLFNEFEDQAVYSVLGSGDVKYHKGYRHRVQTTSGAEVHTTFAPNPSHLEFVDPVVEGIARAKQDLVHKYDRVSVLPLLMHGEAAFVGQGVVTETLNLSRVDGYATGGTLHVVINNQIGFTTNPVDARSTVYSTDFAKAVQAPIFHVNGEDVDACLWIAELALDFRVAFKKDVVIDMYCFRKLGHNEGDDPSFTQPQAYAEISQKKNVAQLYGQRLIEDGILTESEVKGAFERYAQSFKDSYAAKKPKLLGEACPVYGRLRVPTPPTGVEKSQLEIIADTLINYPSSFTPHQKLTGILEKRVQTLQQGKGIDWGFAEALAYGSLLLQGINVRLSGQDCGRGTFSHRHLALSDVAKLDRYYPLNKLNADGRTSARFEVINSTLSEAAVIGFEFGYSSVAPQSLVMWEAQFGDFANGAQVHIDQFIASSEVKWDQLSGLVLLLPHGFEGQGSEHSSARLERFLQLSAEGNMVVCYPSNARQIFHLLRRQGLMEIKRPLVVMTPKSLLRLPDATSAVEEFTAGQFEPVIEDDILTDSEPAHVVLLSGKIYYEVAAAIKKQSGPSVKLIRLEQLHPFPQFELKKALKDIRTKSFFWVQEEPQNMGAWSYLEPYLKGKLEINPIYIGRPAAASPATGSHKYHGIEQGRILNELLSYLK